MLRLEALTKRFAGTLAVDELSLEVRRGEFLSLLGPSGCGKTTTLRMIAGFESPSTGRIVLADRDVTRLPPQRRGMGMVFQNYALFPHLDVYENVAFGLRAQRVGAAALGEQVTKALARVDLAGYERRPVQALSGGQQQRVALARALAPEPPLLLLDEPLSNLDAALRERTRDELRQLLKRVGITAIFVTHDQEEAFALSDRIAVLREGRLQQLGTPEELYRSPANPFVASFVGRANFIDARMVARDGDRGTVELPGGARWSVCLHGDGADSDSGAAPGPAAAPAIAATEVRVMVRPEALRLAPGAGAVGSAALAGRVLERRFAGAVTVYRVGVPALGELVVTIPGHGGAHDGDVLVTAEEDPPLHAFPRDVV
jgi:ABC-type Fe3+/spermidine/putrescine transport system ATPase subunit